jgi:hypothetical protein
MLVEQWRANFWNPEWEGAKLPREIHRFLLATFKKASEEFAEGKIAGSLISAAMNNPPTSALSRPLDTGTSALRE